jgi:hypothetical protein
MGTAHGAEELGMCLHGHACQADAWGRYIGFCRAPGYGHIWTKLNLKKNKEMPVKIFCEAYNFVP